MSVPTMTSRTGTPSTTTRPSGTDEVSRITATTMIATIAPAPRAVMSTTLPMWLMSAVPMLTTSPVASRLRQRGAEVARPGAP